MASSLASKSLFSLLIYFSLLLILAHATLNLHSSDRDAILTVRRELGLNYPSQRSIPATYPCGVAGVHCERRRDPDGSSVILRVTRIILESKGLTGTLSPAIGRLSELRELSLSQNLIVDRLPPQIVDCRKLRVLNLSSNRLSGDVPPELSSLVRLRVLDLSSNRLSGSLNCLEHLTNLERLSLADNLFTGRAPRSLRSFRNLRFSDLSGNSFLSESTSEDSKPKRYVLAETLSSNNSRNTNSSIPARNNNATRSSNNSSTAAPAPAPSARKDKHQHKKKKKVWQWVLGFAAGALAGTLSGLVFSMLIKLLVVFVKGRGKDHGPSIYSPLIKKAEDLAFLEQEDRVSSLQIIGRGGCGEVYKAELPGSSGKMIAIKKIIQPQREAAELAEEDSKLMNKKMRQIRSEINTVSKIRHRNLLPLLAHVSRPDCHYLVYEFMKNGSLQDVMNEVSEGKRELDWPARLKIAIGVAAGLEYLHTSQSPRIIHRDLKPGNVLLDDEMEARIADFGLAKAMPDANTHVTSSNVAGTVGYIAPEYHQTLKFTDKCDIYSFGVLLGVLLMGKLPSDDFFQTTAEMGLVKWLRNVMTSGDPGRAIDPRLVGTGAEEQMLLALKIACFCTVDDPKQRPNSKDVRCMLAQIKK